MGWPCDANRSGIILEPYLVVYGNGCRNECHCLSEMIKRGYPTWMAAGVIASAGGIALLIPPSITLILFGVITEISIVDLFLHVVPNNVGDKRR